MPDSVCIECNFKRKVHSDSKGQNAWLTDQIVYTCTSSMDKNQGEHCSSLIEWLHWQSVVNG